MSYTDPQNTKLMKCNPAIGFPELCGGGEADKDVVPTKTSLHCQAQAIQPSNYPPRGTPTER